MNPIHHPPFPLLSILDVPVHSTTMTETLDYLSAMMEQDNFNLVVTLGTEMIMRAQWDHQFRSTIKQASLVVPDSIGVVWAAQHRGFHLPERVTGVDLTVALAQRLASSRARVFLLGAQPEVAEHAGRRLAELAPGIIIAGSHHGYFTDDDEVLEPIRQAQPDVLLVSLGFPRQEQWLLQHGPQLGIKIGIGVGGTLDVLAGRLSRAPLWVQRYGLEWLYRVVRQPQRIPRLMSLPHFVLKILFGGASAVQELEPSRE